MLPTPTASTFGTSNNGSPHDGREEYATKGKASLATLATLARHGLLPTVTVRGNYNTTSAGPRSGDGLATVIGGPLNPRFLEWLMGFPNDWSESACSGTLFPLNSPP